MGAAVVEVELELTRGEQVAEVSGVEVIEEGRAPEDTAGEHAELQPVTPGQGQVLLDVDVEAGKGVVAAHER